MLEKQMLICFVVYVIANFIAILFSSKIVNDVTYATFKLICFTILLTILQFVLEHFVKLNILYTIFVFPIIYTVIIYVLAKATKLIRVNRWGPALKTALIVVFFQICTRFALEWKLGQYLNNINF